MSYPNNAGAGNQPPQNPAQPQAPIGPDNSSSKTISGQNSMMLFAGLGIVMTLGVCCFAGVLLVVVSNFFTDSSATKVVYSFKRKTSLEVPANWKHMDLNQSASIEYGNPLAKNYVILVSQEKSAAKREVDLGERRDRRDRLTLKQYGESVVNQIKTGGLWIASVQEKTLTIHEWNAIQYRIDGQVKGAPIVYLVTVVEGPIQFHQILGWTVGNVVEENIETQKSIALSFKAKGPEPLDYSGQSYN